MKKQPARILCVDDHRFLIEGLRARFELETDLEFVGALSSADNLLSEARRLSPDIVLLDIEMPGPDPFEAADDLRRILPDVRVIVLSAYVRDHYISAAVRAGAWGYLSKDEETDVIIDGIRRVIGGDFAFSPRVQERCQPGKKGGRDRLVPPSTKLDALTPREQEVLRLIGRGKTRAQIAEILCRSPKTIDGHRESIMEKLGIRDRAELVRFSIREGLVEV
ncbi:MAG: response regulator transcription factor [Planctomycetes bacterium]|nr:response regulator transcription factor [Planctomycetota bacterium]